MFYACYHALMSEWEDDKHLEFDIASALAASPLRIKAQGRDALKIVARTVIAHLKRCRWRLERMPPPEDFKDAP